MIPKELYFIHLGGGELPEFARRNIEGWKALMPAWGVHVVTEADRPRTPFEDLYARMPHAVAKCDLDRVSLLYNFGGVYLDYDMEPRRALDPIIETGCALAIGVSKRPSAQEGNVFEHAFLAMERGHPMGALWLQEIEERLRSYAGAQFWRDYIEIGLGLWGEIVDAAAGETAPHRAHGFVSPVWAGDALILPYVSFYLMQIRATRAQCEVDAATNPLTFALHNARGDWKRGPNYEETPRWH